jgi:hypothetical protein
MSFELLIKCKSRAQAKDIAAHFQVDRTSEEFLNDRLFENSGECINGATIEYQCNIIIVNIE